MIDVFLFRRFFLGCVCLGFGRVGDASSWHAQHSSVFAIGGFGEPCAFYSPTVSDAGFAEVDPEVFAYRDAFAKSETHVIRSSLNYKF